MYAKEILSKAVDEGIIDLPIILEQVNMSERKRLLNKHKENIWVGSDGRYKTHLPDKSRKLVSKSTKEELEDYLVTYYKEQEDEPTFADVYFEWLEKKMMRGEIQLQSKLRYQNDYDKYIKGSIIDVKIKEIDEVLLEDFVFATIRNYNLKNKAWSNVRTIIRGVFKYAKKKGLTELSISQFFGDLEISNKVFKQNHMVDNEQVFTQEEVVKLVKRAYDSNIVQELAVAFAFQTGLRAGEISALTWDDIHDNYVDISKTEIRTRDENNKQIYVVRDSPKTENGFRKVYFTDDAKVTIKKVRKINPFTKNVFCNSHGERMHGQLLGYTCKAMCAKLGIKQRSIHKCRKTYATTLINAKVDEKLIQSQLGHADISTTRKYYYFDNISEEEALTQLQRVKNAF